HSTPLAPLFASKEGEREHGALRLHAPPSSLAREGAGGRQCSARGVRSRFGLRCETGWLGPSAIEVVCRGSAPGRVLAPLCGAMSAIEVVTAGVADPLSEPSLARELAQRFLVWDAFVGGRRRVDLHPLLLPRAMHESAARAAESVVRHVSRAAAFAHEDA